MTVNPALATRTYAAALKNLDKAGANAQEPEINGNDFAAMLKNSLNSTIDSGKKADAAIVNQAAGKANVVDVVTSVAEAEVALKTMVAVRDRVIGAYQDIMRMPI